MVNKELNIYLADDHEIVAKAISGLISTIDEVKEVRTFLNGKDLIAACKSAWPNIIFIDIEMPGLNGLQTLTQVKELCSVPAIILSMNDEIAVVEEAIRCGAAGYLHKNCSVNELREAIFSVLEGKLFLSEEIKKVLVGLLPKRVQQLDLPQQLTNKEFEVLQLVCEGLTSKEIGEKLYLSPRTVEARKNSLMQKFNVQSTGKLIATALKNKIVK